MSDQINRLPVSIYAESTPNPISMKFVADKQLVAGSPIEFLSVDETNNSPLAGKLFQYPFVRGVFIASNFITVNISDAVDWNDIVLEFREMIQQFLSEGNLVIKEPISGADIQKDFTTSIDSNRIDSNLESRILSDQDLKIAQILDEQIRPAVEQDGGAINFKSFIDGKVTVELRGACSGCPSSTVTLKSGIETLLKRLVPEVKEVIAEEL
ncbi:MAG TPA: NifU family protein [Flavobacteriales bacterium]|nr:NifU family protein [Flavobacteriales bacterium]